MKKNLPAVIKNQKVQKKKKRTPFFNKNNSKKWQDYSQNSIKKNLERDKMIEKMTSLVTILSFLGILGYNIFISGAKTERISNGIKRNNELNVQTNKNVEKLVKLSEKQLDRVTKLEINQGKIESKTELLYEDFKNRKVK